MKNKKNILNIILFVIFVVIIFIISLHHENWRDEAQSFLLCRDMSFIDLLKNVHYEGHPFFYYFVLYPFIKLGAGPKVVNIFSFIFMTSFAFILIFKTKLNFIQKIAVLISYPVLYEFSVVGRSYSLVSLLLIIYAVLYPNRKKYPIILSIILGLLANTHLLIGGFVIINSFLFYVCDLFKSFKDKSLKQKKNLLIGFFIIVFFGIVLIIQFIPMFYVSDGINSNTSFSFLSFLFIGAISCYCTYFSFIITYILLIIFLNKLYKIDLFTFISFVFSLLWMCIYVELFSFSLHIISLLLIVLYIHIIMLDNKIKNNKFITIFMVVISLFSFIRTLYAYTYDYKYNYSNAYDTAKYINKNIDSDAILICDREYMCSSIVPYVDNKFYNIGSDEYFTYVVWKNSSHNEILFSDVEKYFDNIGNKKLYYIYSGYVKADEKILKNLKNNYNISLVYKSNSKTYDKNGESYNIYKIENKKG